jgi:hypothetical protein
MSDDNFCRSIAQANQDRAAAVTTAILHMITDVLRSWVHSDPRTPMSVRREIEPLLREEFEGVTRQVRGERDPLTDR